MTARIFISFDDDDAAQVNGFRGLIANDNHPLDAYDRSLREPVRDAWGNPIKVPPSDPSLWVDWEIKTFYDMKLPLSGEDSWKRIRGMWLKGATGGEPAALGGRATKSLKWDPVSLDRWLGQPV